MKKWTLSTLLAAALAIPTMGFAAGMVHDIAPSGGSSTDFVPIGAATGPGATTSHSGDTFVFMGSSQGLSRRLE